MRSLVAPLQLWKDMTDIHCDVFEVEIEICSHFVGSIIFFYSIVYCHTLDQLLVLFELHQIWLRDIKCNWTVQRNPAHHILSAIRNKNQSRLQKREKKRKSRHAKSISTLWWGHEFQRIWNCQAARTRYIVVIKREGMMIMRFDWRLPRQERPWREWRRCYLFALLQAGQWKIHLHCSTSQFGAVQFFFFFVALDEMKRETISSRLRQLKVLLCF